MTSIGGNTTEIQLCIFEPEAEKDYNEEFVCSQMWQMYQTGRCSKHILFVVVVVVLDS